MKRNITLGLILLLILLFLGSPSVGLTASMSDYCQVPPFIGSGGQPNVLIVNDASGSMSDAAYSYGGTPYDPTVIYEGYFDPVKGYVLRADGIYGETNGLPCSSACGTGNKDSKCVKDQSYCANAGQYGSGQGSFNCTSKGNNYGCCVHGVSTGDCGAQSGNYLNYLHMHRIDLQRWAITGGRPATCLGSFSSDQCDPELWNQSGSTATGKIGTVCNNNLDVNGDGIAEGGCILQSDDSTQVRVRWSRVNAGLAYQFMLLPVIPKLGVMTFSGTSVRPDKVFIGDFTASNNNSATMPFINFITNLNSEDPSGNTPTGPAMWDALNYFAQSPAQYGGFPVQTGSGDRWKNPLFTCDGQGGNNCIQNSCARNFVILISDGEWNSPSSFIGNKPSCSGGTQSADPVVPGYCMHMGFTNLMGGNSADYVKTKINNVYTIGLFMDPVGLNAMENVAMYGAFDNSALTWPTGVTGFPTTVNGSLTAPIPATPPLHPDWDRNSDGVPDTFFSSDDALGIRQNIMDVMQDILARATSGTAASVLASGEGSGANLVQATYYPQRRFFNASAAWIGGLQNIWYYIDPRFANTSMREDDGDRVLHIQTDGTHNDYIVQMYFDPNAQKAMAHEYSSDATGAPVALIGTKDIDALSNLWEAGVLLWNRDPADRTIYTTLDTSQPLTASANKFSASSPNNVAALRPFLNTDDPSATATENNQLAANIINYVRGADIANYVYSAGTKTELYRTRALQIDLNNNGNVTDSSVSVNGIIMNETVAKVWKLGDIIDSTPKIASWVRLNDYDTRYGDSTYSSYLLSGTYTNRGTVFVGANDGMLHAFNLGLMQQAWSGQSKLDKARLLGTDLGKEMWAFIPKNVLPYLKYLKENNYCHVTSVDLTPFVFDASINKPAGCTATNYWDCPKVDATNWRTILVGGLRLGGACRDTASTCTDCVKTPVTGNGYSSYFALDVTDPANPIFLWEFSDPTLGFASTGPAVVRMSARTVSGSTSSKDNSKNGRWFVVFGSGPTGPIDPVSQKFLGRSDQNLKIFVLDLVTGVQAANPIDTGIPYAFAGSMLNATFDTDLDYQDDVVYIPYIKRTGSNSNNYSWTDGGVLRLLTNQNLNGSDTSPMGNTALNPANWRISTLIDGIGPVSSAVNHVYDSTSDKVWALFGTGRYFYKTVSATDDQNGQRTLFSMTDPCWQNVSVGWNSVCLDNNPGNDLTRSLSDLSLINLSSSAGTNNPNGWYINLELSGVYTYDENNNGTTADDVPRTYSAERVITDPLTTSQGLVFFTTFKPYNDQCSIGGKSFIWAAYYSTGAAGGNLLQGTALIQVSTGSIEQMKLSTAFSQEGGRRTSAIEGVPPTSQGLSIMSTPNPIRRVLHMKER